MPKNRIALILGLSLLVCVSIMLYFDSSFEFVIPSIRLLVVTLTLYVIFWSLLIFHLYVQSAKKAGFLLITYVIVLLGIEVSFRFWVINFAPRLAQARYLEPVPHA